MSSAENDETRRLNSKYEYRNPKQIQSYNVLMTETNTPSCILETKCRTIQFRSFGFWPFDIALRLPVIRIGLYNRPLRVVSLSNHFEFRISRFEFLDSIERCSTQKRGEAALSQGVRDGHQPFCPFLSFLPIAPS